MKKYVEKRNIVEVMTFEEFVQDGLNFPGASIHEGVPWSWTFDGCPVTHERDDHYLICSPWGTINFRSHDVMVKQGDGGYYPIDSDVIRASYVEIKP